MTSESSTVWDRAVPVSSYGSIFGTTGIPENPSGPEAGNDYFCSSSKVQTIEDNLKRDIKRLESRLEKQHELLQLLVKYAPVEFKDEVVSKVVNELK